MVPNTYGGNASTARNREIGARSKRSPIPPGETTMISAVVPG